MLGAGGLRHDLAEYENEEVEIKPCQELSRPARKILSSVFTSVFPSRRVHSSKFPVFLSGLITLAYLFSSSSPAS